MLSEGLHEDDLDGVLIPVISIDEYYGKINDDSIVVSFFLTDPNAALDLSSFIESGPFDILDSDVSKSINDDGYYQVFIEMERSKHFYYDLNDIIDSLQSLVGDQNWSFMAPHTKGESIKFDKSSVKQYVDYGPQNYPESKKETMSEAVMDFLSNSRAEDVKLSGDHILISNNFISEQNEFVTLSDTSLVYHLLNLSSKGSNNSSKITETIDNLSNILGDGWLVESVGSFILVSSEYSPRKTLLLK